MFFPWPSPVIRMDKYSDRVGSIYAQIDHTKFRNRLIPLFFICKRILFAVGAWYIKIELVALFGIVTMINLCLILWTRPYLEATQFKIELFNEGIALTFFISLQYFMGDISQP